MEKRLQISTLSITFDALAMFFSGTRMKPFCHVYLELKIYFTFVEHEKTVNLLASRCTVNSKINGNRIGVYLRISKLHSILVVANLLEHNNITINYYMQVNSLKAKIECSFEIGK